MDFFSLGADARAGTVGAALDAGTGFRGGLGAELLLDVAGETGAGGVIVPVLMAAGAAGAAGVCGTTGLGVGGAIGCGGVGVGSGLLGMTQVLLHSHK